MLETIVVVVVNGEVVEEGIAALAAADAVVGMGMSSELFKGVLCWVVVPVVVDVVWVAGTTLGEGED